MPTSWNLYLDFLSLYVLNELEYASSLVKQNLPYFSWYRLFFTAGEGEQCSNSGKIIDSENISPSRLPLTLEFKPGIKAVQGIKLEMDTLGNYTICYQAVVQDTVGIITNVNNT